MDQPFLTVDEAASYLRISRQTITRLIKEDKLNATKANKSYRIPIVAFEKFVKYNSNLKFPFDFNIQNARNCTLEYKGKQPEVEVLTQDTQNKLKLSIKEHDQFANSFYYGDNLEVLKLILPELQNKVDLIYIDPPFGTGQSFRDINKEDAYDDSTLNQEFLEFIRQRLILLREFLSPSGSIYLHIDKKIGHYVKILMDEIFGYKNFINDITRIKCNPKNFSRNAYGNYSDMILFYAKEQGKNIFNNIREPLTKEEEEKLFPKIHPSKGRYTTNPLHAPGTTHNGDTGKSWKGMNPPAGRHWRYGRDELNRLDNADLIEWSDKGNPRKMVFLDDHKGKKTQDVWHYKDKGLSFVSYPTQKNHDLLDRIIRNSSNQDSIVLDCFAGSGGTLKIAADSGRRWIGIDQSPLSYEVIRKEFSRSRIRCNYFTLDQPLN